MFVYKVVSQSEWADAQRDGVFRGSEVDHKDGYIHLSGADQVEKTVALYFGGRDDLMLVALDPQRFGDALKWEPSRGGALFPHLYGTLSVAEAAWARPFSSREPESLSALVAPGA